MFIPELYLFQRNDTSVNCLVGYKQKDESRERPFTSFDVAAIIVFSSSAVLAGGGHNFSQPQADEIARYQFAGEDGLPTAVTPHPRLRGQMSFEGSNGIARLKL